MKLNQTYRYEEENWIAVVELLADLTRDEELCYQLRVVKTVQPPTRYKQPPDGTVFECAINRLYEDSHYHEWRLTEEGYQG